MAFAYSPKIVTDGLVLYLDAANPYSYVSGSTAWNDISRSQLSGSLVNGPTFNSANGGSIIFNGTNNFGYISNSFNSYTNFTVGFFIRINTTTNHRGIFCVKNAADTIDYGSGNYAIHTLSGGYFGMECSDLFGGNTSRNNTVINQKISYCVVVCNQSSNLVTYYLNGVPDGMQVISSTYTFTDHDIVFLACRQYASTGTSSVQNHLNGTVYSYQFYNRALSASEVLQNYNATKGRYGLT